MTTGLEGLADMVHTTQRFTKQTALAIDGHIETLCALHFIGAEHYFISEDGAVWEDRLASKAITIHNRVLNRNYLPLVHKDKYYDLPWVFIPTNYGKIWFPVIQLLGWAYHPNPDKAKRYYLPQNLSLPLNKNKLILSSTAPEISENSLYTKFMQLFYL